MMTKCPQCGSTEIVPDLIVFTVVEASRGTLFVSLMDPAKKGERVEVGFRAAICGARGHNEMYTRYPQDVLDAHKKGYVTQAVR
jgi:hypothetical protein